MRQSKNGFIGRSENRPSPAGFEHIREHDGNPNIFLRLQVGLYDHGFDRAVSSGALERDEDELRTLVENAKAMGEETYQREFDPSTNIDDKLKEENYLRNQKELEYTILGIKHAKAELRRREDEAARLKTKVPAEPEFPVFAACFGLSVIALTVAPSLHDSVFTSLGNDWAWTFALLTGLVWGGFVTYAILDGGRESKERTLMNLFGLIAAVGMAIALGLIRLINASGISDYLVAIGFSLLEIFVALGLEAAAQKYHRQLDEYEGKASASREAVTLAETVETDVNRRLADSEKLEIEIRHYRNYVAERELRANHKSELIESAVKAVVDGYHAGIRSNRGKVLGIAYEEVKS